MNIMNVLRSIKRNLSLEDDIIIVDKALHLRYKAQHSKTLLKKIHEIRYARCLRSFNCSIPLSAKIGDNISFPHMDGIHISGGGQSLAIIV